MLTVTPLVPQAWNDLQRGRCGAEDYGPATPVRIFQHEWEFEQLLQLYRLREPQKVLEIGTFHGGSLYHLLREAPNGATVVSVDNYAAGVDNRSQYGQWCPDDVTLHVIAGNSQDAKTIEQVQGFAPYEFIFIDAGHLYHEVATDWHNYRPMADLGFGSVVAFHDIVENTKAHPEIEVYKLWEAIRRSGYVTQEFVCGPEMEWGGIGIVYL